MTIDFGTVIATTFVQTLAIYIFKQAFERRDERIKILEEKLSKVEEEKLKCIDDKLESGKNGRAELHRKIDAVEKEQIRQSESLKSIQQNFEGWHESLMKLERVSERVNAATDRIQEISDQQFLMAQEISRAAALISHKDKKQGSQA